MATIPPCDVHRNIQPLRPCKVCGDPTAMVCHDCNLQDDLPCACAEVDEGDGLAPF